MSEKAGKLLSPEEMDRLSKKATAVLTELNKAILGQERVLKLIWTAVLARGHVLLEGLPGLGKTQTIKSLSSLLSLGFQRIQFTPDLLPSDITGSSILEETEDGRKLVFHEGPVFSNLILVDEINRASPKTQSALLEAMQERQVTAFGTTRRLPSPFFVLATQNPIELEGTYPLPEAQLDRFLFKVHVFGVGESVLEDIITSRIGGEPPSLDSVLTKEDLDLLLDKVSQIFLPQPVANYISRIVLSSHSDFPYASEEAKKYIKYGASPRAAIAIAGAARARALLDGRPNVSFDDVKEVAPHALVHRIVLGYNARLDGMDAPKMAALIVEKTQALKKDLPEGLEQVKTEAS